MKADRRLTPARPDLAARHLEGRVEAARFADAEFCRVTMPVAPLRLSADAGAPPDTELLFGEDFAVYEVAGPWAWGQSPLDGYVGYVPAGSLASAADAPAPTHRVRTLWSNVYARPALKAPSARALPFAARVAIAELDGGFARIAPDAWVPVRHLAPLAEAEADWVAVAERFLAVPYLWGGRSPLGLDCSGILQLARQAAGHDCPRDSDMQEAGLGETLPPGEEPWRGDLVFWRGHVGVMLDGERLLHANAHHMAVAIEPLAGAIPRIRTAAGGGPVRRHARLDAG